MPGLRLNVGGQHTIDRFPPGWKCLDNAPGSEYQIDLGVDVLPFENNSVEAIYASHVLEHIYPHRHAFIFSEFRRVLRPGGFVRIVVPDMDIILLQYFRKWSKEITYKELPVGVKKKGCQTPPLFIYNVMDWWFGYDLNKSGEVVPDHVTGFTVDVLNFRMQEAGFKSFQRSAYGKGNAVFYKCDNPIHESTSVYVEAKKIGN